MIFSDLEFQGRSRQHRQLEDSSGDCEDQSRRLVLLIGRLVTLAEATGITSGGVGRPLPESGGCCEDRTMTIDEILLELGRISDRLESGVDRDEQAALLARRAELRRLARDAVPTTRAALRSELELLVKQWDRLAKERLMPVPASGTGGGDVGFITEATGLNRAIDAAGGREELERRIRVLRDRLGD